MMKNTFKALALAVGIAGYGSAAFATPVLSNGNGSFANWGGFDWASNGTAVVEGYAPVLNDEFTLTYFASAATVTALGGSIIPDALFRTEYTIVVNLTEKVTSISADLLSATFAGVDQGGGFAGSFSIYYGVESNQPLLDGGGNSGVDTRNADQVTGAGFTDGILLISGKIFASDTGSFTAGATGGQATLRGIVDYTNSTYISPELVSTIASTTLQLGDTTAWTAPTSKPGVNGGTEPIDGLGGTVGNGGAVLLQADANQTFSAIPEPGTLALIGISFIGLGAIRRRFA